MKTSRENFLDDINFFLGKTGMSPHALGRAALNDGKFVGRVAGGAGCTLDSADSVRAFMAKYKPPAPVKKNNRQKHLPVDNSVTA